MANEKRPIIIVKRKKHGGGGHHGGAWKVAYADFVTAMMAFFMVMWLVATMPQEQLGGLADYFKNPSAVEGRAAAAAPGAMGPGGAGNAPVKIFDQNAPPPGTDPGDGKVDGKAQTPEQQQADLKEKTEAELEAELREREKKVLEELMEQLKAAIENSQALAPFKDQLLIDITPEGLRIQIIDKMNRPMFDLGSPSLKGYTKEILIELARYFNTVPNRISLTGHTDVTPYNGGNLGYSNWELSADRANAARRALTAGGIDEAKIARVVGLSSTILFDKQNPSDPSNRRISIIVLNKLAEEAAAKQFNYGAQTDLAPAGTAAGEQSTNAVSIPAEQQAAPVSATLTSPSTPSTPATASAAGISALPGREVKITVPPPVEIAPKPLDIVPKR